MKPMYIYNNLSQFFLEWAQFQTKVVEKIKTHFVFNNFVQKIMPFY
jgi:hypothetical protein